MEKAFVLHYSIFVERYREAHEKKVDGPCSNLMRKMAIITTLRRQKLRGQIERDEVESGNITKKFMKTILANNIFYMFFTTKRSLNEFRESSLREGIEVTNDVFDMGENMYNILHKVYDEKFYIKDLVSATNDINKELSGVDLTILTFSEREKKSIEKLINDNNYLKDNKPLFDVKTIQDEKVLKHICGVLNEVTNKKVS